MYFLNILGKDTKMLTLVSIENNVNTCKKRVEEKKEEKLFHVHSHIIVIIKVELQEK